MKKSIAIVGGGPAGMALATQLNTALFEVTIYDRNKALGRKFLVAGKGGFNLTHATPMPAFANQYTPASFLKSSLSYFDNENFRTWLNEIGIPTFVGTSKRIFPEKGIKPIEVLNCIKRRLEENNVQIKYNHKWNGWDQSGNLIFENRGVIKADSAVFALGGGSWKITGSDGRWLKNFARMNIKTVPFSPSNCGYKIDWPKNFIQAHEGKPLKNISISISNKTIKGEIVLTNYGIEGNAIYALSPNIRKALNLSIPATIYLDLKPTISEADVLKKLNDSANKKVTEILKRSLKLSKAQLALLKQSITKEEFLNKEKLSKYIKQLPLKISGMAPIDQAISSVGGISLKAVDTKFQLIDLPENYCIGEMLDWDAPTGGYLLQACFSMGFKLASELNSKNY